MKLKTAGLSHRFEVCRLQTPQSVSPLSHSARRVVVVVMVAVLRVCNLNAGFPLRLFAIGCVGPRATRRALLEEIRHKPHLCRKRREKRAEQSVTKEIFFPQRSARQHARDTVEVRAGLETVITYVWRSLRTAGK